MMRKLIFLTMTLGVFSQFSAAEDMQATLEEYRCGYCHKVDSYYHAPSFKDIAMRYAADKQRMLKVLPSKIIHGGAGNWGVVPMVTNHMVSPAAAHELAEWILDLK